jgi:hypothetical protein
MKNQESRIKNQEDTLCAFVIRFVSFVLNGFSCSATI